MKIIDGGVTAAKGFLSAATAAGIKYKDRMDMAMIYSQKPCVAAGTFTTNIVKAAPVKKSREYRKVPEMRLEARLGLSRYNVPAPLRDETVSMPNVTVKMSQHIGAPASPAVNVGDMVKTGDVVGMPGNGLSVAVHASIDGKVVAADKDAVTIQRVVQ